MNYFTSVFLAATIVVLLHLHVVAQSPNVSGTWVLNLDKSVLEHKPDGLTGSIFIIKQSDNEFKLTRYHIFGEHKKKISFKIKTDGSVKTVKLLFKGKIEKEGNELVASLWRKNFSNIVHYKFGATHDELVADEVMKSIPNNHHNIWVFDKVVSK